MERPESGKEKGPYDKPAVESEEVFETLALTCTKADVQCSVAAGDQVTRS